MTTPHSAHLTDRQIIELTGSDTRNFLQGLISNDIDKLAPHRPLYAAMLTPQGKFLFDFILIEHEHAIWLDTSSASAAELVQKMTMYRMRAAVVLTLREDLAVCAAWGGQISPQPNWVSIEDPRLPALGDRLIGPKERLDALSLNSDAEAYDRHRLDVGVPRAGVDLLPQKSILLECNFEELNGVSFTKGCFIGQELTARTKHRALIKKRLLPIRIDGATPEPFTLIMAGEKEAGDIRSVHGDIGLALLRLERLGQPLDADGSKISLRTVDWLSISTS